MSSTLTSVRIWGEDGVVARIFKKHNLAAGGSDRHFLAPKYWMTHKKTVADFQDCVLISWNAAGDADSFQLGNLQCLPTNADAPRSDVRLRLIPCALMPRLQLELAPLAEGRKNTYVVVFGNQLSRRGRKPIVTRCGHDETLLRKIVRVFGHTDPALCIIPSQARMLSVQMRIAGDPGWHRDAEGRPAKPAITGDVTSAELDRLAARVKQNDRSLRQVEYLLGALHSGDIMLDLEVLSTIYTPHETQYQGLLAPFSEAMIMCMELGNFWQTRFPASSEDHSKLWPINQQALSAFHDTADSS